MDLTPATPELKAELADLLADHDPSWGFPREHTDLQAAFCACRQPNILPNKSGDACANCGGVNMLPTGSCHTCMDCGTSGGCS